MLPFASRTVTVKLWAAPAGVGDGIARDHQTLLAAAGLTMIPDWVPLIELLAVSVAVIDCVPAVFSVARRRATPLSPPVPW